MVEVVGEEHQLQGAADFRPHIVVDTPPALVTEGAIEGEAGDMRLTRRFFLLVFLFKLLRCISAAAG